MSMASTVMLTSTSSEQTLRHRSGREAFLGDA